MVFPYTPFGSQPYYDMISQEMMPLWRYGDKPEFLYDESLHLLTYNRVQKLLFNYTDEEREEFKPDGKLYLSRMFVYCVEVTKGFLNQCVVNTNHSKLEFINNFFSRIGSQLGSNEEYYEKDIPIHDINNLYDCALSFYACQFVVFALNSRGGEDSEKLRSLIAAKMVSALGLSPYTSMSSLDVKTISEINQLSNLIMSSMYGLKQLGGEQDSSDRVSISFFVSYLSDDKLVFPIGEWLPLNMNPIQSLIFSRFPSLPNYSFYTNSDAAFYPNRVIDRLTRNWEHREFSKSANAHVGNSLYDNWTITRAVFELTPPPPTLLVSPSNLRLRTLNFSVYGFLEN